MTPHHSATAPCAAGAACRCFITAVIIAVLAAVWLFFGLAPGYEEGTTWLAHVRASCVKMAWPPALGSERPADAPSCIQAVRMRCKH
jgi:hypothetical protein